VEDLADAEERYARFTGIAPVRLEDGVLELRTEREWIRFCDRARLERDLGITGVQLPVIAACTLRSSDLAACRRLLEGNGLAVVGLPSGTIAVRAPAAIGGMFVFAQA
jgi:hypothetical protein